MIRSFRDKETQSVWHGRPVRRWPIELQEAARRKLRMLHNAQTLVDLRSPPANRLEALKGDRSGRYSIRINAQWRLCFVWSDGGADSVEIVDYH
jgi:proteic killer suppression protein